MNRELFKNCITNLHSEKKLFIEKNRFVEFTKYFNGVIKFPD